MSTRSARRFATVPDIDLFFRPQTYFWPLGHVTHHLARITIASTPFHGIRILARCGKRRIYYRVVDEYGCETLSRVGAPHRLA